MDHYIFSRSLSLPEPSDVTLVRENWQDHLITLRQGQGGDIYLCGGGMFAGFVADCGLLDRIVLKVAPVVIGKGVPLFAGLERAGRFHRRHVKLYDNGVTLVELELRQDIDFC